MTNPKVLPVPAKEHRHDLTEAQIATIQPMLQQLNEIQRFLSFFIGYVEREDKLPASTNGYRLATDEDGTPYMTGTVEKKHDHI